MFDLLTLEDRNKKSVNKPTIDAIRKALTDLTLSKTGPNPQNNYVSLLNIDELEMQIYKQTIVLQDWGKARYDGPGGPGELLRIRYKDGSLIYKIEEAAKYLNDEEREKLIELLNNLPKPE